MSTETRQSRLGVRVLTPEGAIYDGPAAMVIAPSVMGEVGILPRHAPLIAFMRVGETRINMLGDEPPLVLATGEGYLSVEDDTVLVMVEQADRADHIDRARAEASLASAEEALAAAGEDDSARMAAEGAKRRAANRLRIVDKK